MAKQRQDGIPGAPPDIGLDLHKTQAEQQKMASDPHPVEKSLWSVTLSCPTPLKHATLEVEAATEEEAKQEFMRQNGICGSIHQWTVVKVC